MAEEHQPADSKFRRQGAVALLLLLFGISLLWNGLVSTSMYLTDEDTSSHVINNNTTPIQGTEATNKCLNILAVGTSITVGSAGFHGAHPDAPGMWKDPWLLCYLQMGYF
jgi:hypothetical protein